MSYITEPYSHSKNKIKFNWICLITQQCLIQKGQQASIHQTLLG